jgi:hypothetical protein
MLDTLSLPLLDILNVAHLDIVYTGIFILKYHINQR